MRFSGVGGRLAAALAVVLLAAFAIGYAIVVPSFERALVNGKLDTLERNAGLVAEQVSRNPAQAWQALAEEASAESGARTVVYTYSEGLLQGFADSNPGRADDLAADPIAERAAVGGRPAHGTVSRGEGSYAEAAVPVRAGGAVVLLSASLHDTLATIDLVQRRLLIAALIAFVCSLLLGYGGARIFARRLRRLERGVDRIAGGSFDEAVVDHGADEIGELSRAFERMRLRLAQLERARNEFIANASHELRTPLFSLGGFLELVDGEELDEETRRDFVAQMREQVDRLTKLATDLLDLSRLDAGRVRVERDRIDLGPVAAAVASEFHARGRRSGHDVDVEVAGSIAALGDEQRVLQIGRILVDNALRHTPSGTRVRVRAARAGGTAVLAVEDDGPGIPSESVRQVFERFYRLGGTVAAGSGLGLAIARELAELMGGRLELESAPGRTVFSLVLAAAPVREREPAVFA